MIPGALGIGAWAAVVQPELAREDDETRLAFFNARSTDPFRIRCFMSPIHRAGDAGCAPARDQNARIPRRARKTQLHACPPAVLGENPRP